MKRFFSWRLQILLWSGLAIATTMLVAVFSPHRYHSLVPLTFNKCGQPYIEVTIDKNIYTVMLDSGSVVPLSLHPSLLPEIQKNPYGLCHSINCHGEKHNTPSYIIPQMKIGSHSFDNMIFAATRDNAPRDGYIGWFFFSRVNVLIDVANARMYISNDWKKLREEGYDLTQMMKVALVPSYEITILTTTDLGTHRSVVDTGSTCNALQQTITKGHPEIRVNHLWINGHDFGPTSFEAMNLPADGIDGIIGLDFLKNHPIYIDYNNETLYIKK